MPAMRPKRGVGNKTRLKAQVHRGRRSTWRSTAEIAPSIHREVKAGYTDGTVNEASESAEAPAATPATPPTQRSASPGAKSAFWLTRFIILRWLGLVYFV